MAIVSGSMAKKPAGQDSALLSALSYIFFIVAVLVYMIKKEDKIARLHAVQAMLMDVAFMVFWFIGFAITFVSFFTFVLPFILIPLMMLAMLCYTAYKLYLAWKAYNGESIVIPVITRQAERFV